MSLTVKEVIILSELINKLKHSNATPPEIRRIIRLISKSGKKNSYQLQRYAKLMGYHSVKGMERKFPTAESNELLDDLIRIGVAVLIAYGISKLLEG